MTIERPPLRWEENTSYRFRLRAEFPVEPLRPAAMVFFLEKDGTFHRTFNGEFSSTPWWWPDGMLKKNLLQGKFSMR